MPKQTRCYVVKGLFAIASAAAALACSEGGTSPGASLTPIDRQANVLYQYLVPISDVSNPGSWGPTPLWQGIDESPTANDADYIERIHWGDTQPIYAQSTVRLTTASPDSAAWCKLFVRYRFSGNYSTTTPQPTLLYVQLFSGSTVVDQRTMWPSTSYVTDSSMAALGWTVTHSGGLTVRFSAQLKAQTQFDQISARVSQAVLRCPAPN